jgi:hypothetical protein
MVVSGSAVLMMVALIQPLCCTTGLELARGVHVPSPGRATSAAGAAWLQGHLGCWRRMEQGHLGCWRRLASAWQALSVLKWAGASQCRVDNWWGCKRLRGGGTAADADEDIGMMSSFAMLSPDGGLPRTGVGSATRDIAPRRQGQEAVEMEGRDSRNEASGDDNSDEWQGEDTLRDQLQVLTSLRAARKEVRVPRGEEETREAAAATGESVFAGVCEAIGPAGVSGDPVKVVLQGRRVPSKSGDASAAASGGGGGAQKKTWENGWWGDDKDGSPAQVNVETLEEALVEAGEGCRVLVESGLHQLPTHVRSIVVPEAGCLQLSAYAHYGRTDGLCRVQSMWRLLEGSHGALQCMGLWSLSSSSSTHDEVCLTVYKYVCVLCVSDIYIYI